MKQNEKDLKNLLLKDLCCRLPYGVKVLYEENIYRISDVSISNKTITICGERGYPIEVEIQKVKPYLFPLSSMTKEQRKEYDSIIYHSVELHCDRYYEVIDVDSFEELQDFYHINHLDYRGLIPMGLAINATGKNIY